MSLFGPGSDASDTIRPSLLHNGVLALGCLVMGVVLLRMDDAKVEGAVYLAAFLVFCAAVIMATHLPGCTGIWLDDDGFLARDMYKSERYRWSEVGPFVPRRRLLGSGVEFLHTPPGKTAGETRSLPRGLGGSGWKIAERMNRRRERALAAGG
jgi:hypothetical protein